MNEKRESGLEQGLHVLCTCASDEARRAEWAWLVSWLSEQGQEDAVVGQEMMLVFLLLALSVRVLAALVSAEPYQPCLPHSDPGVIEENGTKF